MTPDDEKKAAKRKMLAGMPPEARKGYEDADVALRQARAHQKAGDKVGEREAAGRLREAMSRTNKAMQSTHDFNSDVPAPMTKKSTQY